MTSSVSAVRPRLWTSIVLLAALAGCSDSVEPGDIDGTYRATAFTVEIDNETIDVLEDGGSLVLTLSPPNETSGVLVIPGSLSESGTDESLSLVGTYTFDEATGTITFDHASDTFIRDIEWEIDGDEISASLSEAGESLEVTLTKD